MRATLQPCLAALIAAQVPALAELLKMRQQLEELLGYMDGKVLDKTEVQALADLPTLLGFAIS